MASLSALPEQLLSLAPFTHGRAMLPKGHPLLQPLGLPHPWHTTAQSLQPCTAPLPRIPRPPRPPTPPHSSTPHPTPPPPHPTHTQAVAPAPSCVQGTDMAHRRMQAAGYSPNAHTFDILLAAVRHWSALEGEPWGGGGGGWWWWWWVGCMHLLVGRVCMLGTLGVGCANPAHRTQAHHVQNPMPGRPPLEVWSVADSMGNNVNGPHLLKEVQRQVDVLGLPQLRLRRQPRLARALRPRQVDKVQLGAAHQRLARPPRLDVQREHAVGSGGGVVERGLRHHAVGVAQEELRELCVCGGWVGGWGWQARAQSRRRGTSGPGIQDEAAVLSSSSSA